MKVAVVGAGISGLSAACVLARAGVDVVIYEKEEQLGGRARSVTIDGVDVDLGFLTLNQVAYPNLMEFIEGMGIEMEISNMSFSVSLNKGKGYEWGSHNGLASLFMQKSNVVNPYFWQMLREITRFNNDIINYLMEHEKNHEVMEIETLENFIKSQGYSQLFQNAYLIPICSSIWSFPSKDIMSFSASSVFSFFRDHHLLQPFGQTQCLTIKGHSNLYVDKVKQELEIRGCQIKTKCSVRSISTIDGCSSVLAADNSEEIYDACIISIHAPDALKILGIEATYEESRILGAFHYVNSDIYLHGDKTLMPQNQSAWSAWNFLGNTSQGSCVTYWLNVLQNLGSTDLPFLVTLNPPIIPKHNLLKWTTSHPVPSIALSKASLELDKIQGKRRVWFCGPYQGYGFHEDGIKAGIASAYSVLGKDCFLLKSRKQIVPSLVETGARLVLNKFLEHYILTGCITLLEEGGTIFVFEGSNPKSCMKSVLKVHDPLFYWKVALEADIGLADAYINGYFSFVNEKDGLLDLFLILIANRDLKHNSSKKISGRGWWTPLMFTAGFGSVKYFFRHMSRKNTVTQARRNVSLHYDLSNDFFSLFLDETMTYSSAIFQMEHEDLKVAQLRKLSLLIKKARVDKSHHILEIGCGWGSFAIEVVKQTGCRYTGISLSKEQLKIARRRVKDAGLEENITFLLCDYRQVPSTQKFDRIVSCEMIEEIGHEYFEEFFGCCESLLAQDGLVVLQFISIPEERYDEYRRSSDFIKEYIFPGGSLPSLNRVISAMAAGSRLCVEHVENIGMHYYRTLIYWRDNFMTKRSEILALGFDEKFIRTWEYYFIYCAAGFKSRTLGDYQIVLSRPGNVKALGEGYESQPSAI